MTSSLRLVMAVVVVTACTTILHAEDLDSLRRAAFDRGPDTASARALLSLWNADWQNNNDSFPQYEEILAAEVDRYERAEVEPLALLRVRLTYGMLLKMMNKPVASIEQLYAALALEREIDDPAIRATLNREVGLNYYLQGQWEQARAFFVRADSHFVRTNQEQRHRIMEYLVALSESNAGRYADAAPTLEHLYAEWTDDGDVRRTLETGSGYADALRGLGLLDSSATVYEDLIHLSNANEGSIRAIMGRLEAGLARVRYEQGRSEEARVLARSALNYARKFNYFFPKLEALEILYKTNRERQAWEEAYRYLEIYMHDRDSLQSEESRLQLGISQAVFEQERKQAEALAQEVRKQQRLVFGLVLALVLVVVVGFFLRSLSKQKKISEGLLANILPQATIAELKSTGTVAPRIHKGVSIMFCDVKEFTRIAEALSPQDLVSMLDSYIQRFDEIVKRHGLEKIKTIGDAYMVAGGLHGDSTEAARACLAAAREMLAVVEELRKPSTEQYGFSFDYRVGIHTGNVIAGMVGRDKYAYDIWGDAVNVASRMEHHSEIGRINISGDTHTLVDGTVPTEYRGKVTVKNKGDVDMYFVVNRSEGSTA